jgi:hypothetical protein
MKKKMIALAVAAAMVPAFAAAEGASVSGFADITLTSDNDTNVFGAAAEIDVRNTIGSVTVGADVDFNLGTNDTAGTETAGTATLEQAFFAWGAAENLTIIGGAFNNPIGLEGEDGTDIDTATFGQIKNILDNQTALYGNNVAGLAAAYDAGVATVTLALLNDIGHTNTEENSIAVVVNAAPVEGLNLELGYVTQEDQKADGSYGIALGSTISGTQAGSAGNVLDINGTFAVAGATIGLEYLTADNIVDSAIGLHLDYAINDQIGVNVRYDTVAFGELADGTDISNYDDMTSTTLTGRYQIEENLTAYVEWKTEDDVTVGSGDAVDDEKGTIGFIANF